MSGLADQRRQKQPIDPTQVDRLPPHSIEAEQGVLGCVLLAPDECIPECIDRLPGGEEAFYDLRCRTIYSTLLAMYDKRQAIDLITLQQRLKDQAQLEAVGGLAHLSALPDAVPSAANLEYYAEIVRDKHELRARVQYHTESVARIYESKDDVPTIVEDDDRRGMEVRQRFTKGNAIKTTKELVREAVAMIEDMHQRQGALVGLGSGFMDLDKMTGGFRNGDMIVIAGRPSMGKSSLCMNIAEHVAVVLRLPVGVFSLEMTAASLMLRALCSRARVNIRNIQDGFMAERDFPKLANAAGKLASAPLFIDDSSGLTIMQLRARARRMQQQHGIKLFIIDYLQLMAGGGRVENRQQEVSLISCGLKGLAKELNLPVIALSQLSRDIEKDKNRRPRLSDLRESGAIEQDGDVVGILYRPPDASVEDNTMCDAIPTNLWIGKQRQGPTGDIPLTFLRSYTRFENTAKISNEDIPN